MKNQFQRGQRVWVQEKGPEWWPATYVEWKELPQRHYVVMPPEIYTGTDDDMPTGWKRCTDVDPMAFPPPKPPRRPVNWSKWLPWATPIAIVVSAIILAAALGRNVQDPVVLVYPYDGVDYIIASGTDGVAIVPHFDPLP